jgi:hypothetical protein
MHQIATQLQSRHFRQMLVLGDGFDLFFGQVAQLQTVFIGQHGCSLLNRYSMDQNLSRAHHQAGPTLLQCLLLKVKPGDASTQAQTP